MHNNPTRQNIINAADRLFYEQGFEYTSFADIADQINISRGNFYHHFKSKDDILDAVIQHRRQNTQCMLEQWEKDSETPADCIRKFSHILLQNRSKIKRFGCPVGTLSSELTKVRHASRAEATQLFSLFVRWLQKQFKQLGYTAQAKQLAMHLLARSQGIATLASAFHDEKFIKNEVKLLDDWLDNLVKTKTIKKGY